MKTNTDGTIQSNQIKPGKNLPQKVDGDLHSDDKYQRPPVPEVLQTLQVYEVPQGLRP